MVQENNLLHSVILLQVGRRAGLAIIPTEEGAYAW